MSTPTTSLPPGIALYQMAIGHYHARALHLAAKLGIADLIAAGNRTANALATATSTHAPALRRLLRLLASNGVLREDVDGAFELTELGEALRDVPGSSRASVMLFAGIAIQDSWKELEYCVRTGQPAFRKNSPDAIGAFSEMDPEQAAIFDAAMATFAPMTSAAMSGAYDFSQFNTLVDVGGGNGAILCGLLRANEDLQGIVFDRPEVAAGARTHIADGGLATRCDFVPGDFFAGVPSGGDAYLLKHVIHDWDDARATTILKCCRDAMHRSAKLLIAEGIYPAHIDASMESRGAAANDVNMLVVSGGRQRSEDEFRSLFDAAGFELTNIVQTAARLAVIEGVPR